MKMPSARRHATRKRKSVKPGQRRVGGREKIIAGADVMQDMFELVVECCDEQQQKSLYEEMAARGLPCRVLTL
jgi:hypothetical protein